MKWSKDLARIMKQNPTYAEQSYILTKAKRTAEEAIVRRLEMLFGDCLNIEKKGDKYYLNNRIKKELTFEPIGYVDKNNPNTVIWSEWAYDVSRIKEIFWGFIEESINNSSVNVSRQKQICEFLNEVERDLFKSNKERTEYIKCFYKSIFEKDIQVENPFVYDDLGVAPELEERIDEINALFAYNGISDLFNTFEECIESYEVCKWISHGCVLLFENSTESERALFELLYVNLPYELKDYRGSGYGPEGVIKQLRHHCWEKVHPDVRNQIIDAIDVLCENEEIYKYFKMKDDDEILEAIESVKFKLKWPVYYRITQDLSSLISILKQPEAIDEILERSTINDFEEALHRLIEKYFGSQGLTDGRMLDKLIDYSEKNLESLETQLNRYFDETKEEPK